jgi:hypothetical protein
MLFPKQLGKQITSIANVSSPVEPFELSLDGLKLLLTKLRQPNNAHLRERLLFLLVDSKAKFNTVDMQKECFDLLLTELLLYFSSHQNPILLNNSLDMLINDKFYHSFLTFITENKDMFFIGQKNVFLLAIIQNALINAQVKYKELYSALIDTPLFQDKLNNILRFSQNVSSTNNDIKEAVLKSFILSYHSKRTPFSQIEKDTLNKILQVDSFNYFSKELVSLLRLLKSGDLLNGLLASSAVVNYPSSLSKNSLPLKDYIASILINASYYKLDKKTFTAIAESKSSIFYSINSFNDLQNGLKSQFFITTLCEFKKDVLMLLKNNDFFFEDKKVSYEQFLVNKLEEYIERPQTHYSSKEKLITMKQDIKQFFASQDNNKVFLAKIKGLKTPTIKLNLIQFLKDSTTTP